jgi:hypothetical protein
MRINALLLRLLLAPPAGLPEPPENSLFQAKKTNL